MKKFLLCIAMLLPGSNMLFSQLSISTDGCAPDSSAMLEVKSTEKGFLLPRMTVEQRNVIPNPANGLVVYCIDCGLEGSLSVYSNGTWKTFSHCFSGTPDAGENCTTLGQIIWKWEDVENATGYRWSTTNNYSSAMDLGMECSKTESNIACDSSYTRYVWSYNLCANSAVTILTETTYGSAPCAPSSRSHVPTRTQITWKWTRVIGATGYKWNTTNDYCTAEDMETDSSKTETGLTCGTSYTCFAWAYTDCGNSTPVTLTKSTSACWVCGNSITKSHVVGPVAPVNKNVTYGTVTNVPGEPTKCWITRNLGASIQAASKSDTSEAAAGWYWQFNVPQGYKHTVTTRTPNTNWIAVLEEWTNWNAANDPCSIELGTEWHVPTATEWTNVDALGYWTGYESTFNSSLKIHPAGRLQSSDGTLYQRGTQGGYWSGSQFNLTLSQCLYITSSSSCAMTPHLKTVGFPLRCIRN